MAVVEQVLAAGTAADRQGIGCSKRLNVRARLRVPVTAAHHHERPPGLREHVAQLVHVVRPGMRGNSLVTRGVGHHRGRSLHVFRQREHHRSGASRHRKVERVTHHLRHALGAVDLSDPFRHLAVHAPVVDLLECLALGHLVVDLADEQDQRCRVLECRVNADARVGRARAARDEADAGAAGQFAVGVGHVGGAAFLTADHELDCVARAVERIQRAKIAFTRHAKHHVGAVHSERIDQQLAAGAGKDGIRRFHARVLKNMAWLIVEANMIDLGVCRT